MSVLAHPSSLALISVKVLVLAAGQGLRFTASGGLQHKLQAPLLGKAVLTHVLDAVAEAGLQALVVGPSGSSTAGMGDSMACGVHATPEAAGWLILPGDMPLVQPTTLRAVAQQLLASSRYAAIQPVWNGQPGHPVAFARSCAASLLQLTGDQGARAVLQTLRSEGKLLQLPVDDPGIVHDIDTLDDLHHAQAMLAQRKQALPSSTQ